MADETYRKFHSGRFGPQGEVTPDFATKVQSGGSFTNQDTSPKKKEKEKDEEELKTVTQSMIQDYNAHTKAPFGTDSGE